MKKSFREIFCYPWKLARNHSTPVSIFVFCSMIVIIFFIALYPICTLFSIMCEEWFLIHMTTTFSIIISAIFTAVYSAIADRLLDHLEEIERVIK